MVSKIYPGDIFICKKCNTEIRVLKAGDSTGFICCGEEMENIGGLNPATSW